MLTEEVLTNLWCTNPILPNFYDITMSINSFLDYIMSLQVKKKKVIHPKSARVDKYQFRSTCQMQ